MFRQQFYLSVTTLALGFSSINAQATLTSYTANGVDLVYSSVSDVTWTKDGNLLGSLMAASTDNDGNGFLDVIDAIVALAPKIATKQIPGYLPDGIYNLTPSEFSSDGRTTWFGAVAYVNYLNSINYAGSNQWYLPTVENATVGYNTNINGTNKGDELVELYYQELGSKGAYDANGNLQQNYGLEDRENKFINEKSYAYWSGTPDISSPYYDAWVFLTDSGQQNTNSDVLFYSWAVTPGQISPVPAPEAAWLFATGLPIIGVTARRKKQ